MRPATWGNREWSRDGHQALDVQSRSSGRRTLQPVPGTIRRKKRSRSGADPALSVLSSLAKWTLRSAAQPERFHRPVEPGAARNRQCNAAPLS
jgi:hypothetical protein